MAKKPKITNVDWLQDVVCGAAFLMKSLQYTYGDDFSEGMDIQVKKFLADAARVEASRFDKAKAKNNG